AVKLEQVLPGRVGVQRSRRGLLGPKLVRKLTVDTGAGRLELLRGDDDTIETRCSRLSGGIVLKSEVLETPRWLAVLGGALAVEAQRSAQTRQALERLLI